MSEMTRELFAGNPLVVGPVLALLFFVLVFIVAAIRAATAGRSYIDRIAHLPLEGEELKTEAPHV